MVILRFLLFLMCVIAGFTWGPIIGAIERTKAVAEVMPDIWKDVMKLQ